MITRPVVAASLLVSCAFWFVGCASTGPAKLYDGPSLPESQLARITCERHTNQTIRFCPKSYQEIFLSKMNGEKVKPYGSVKDAYLMPGVHDLVFELVLPDNNSSVQSQGGLVGALVAVAANAAVNGIKEQQKKEGRGGLTLCAAMGEKYIVRFYQRVNRAWYWIEQERDGLLVAGQRAGPAFYNSLGTDALLAMYQEQKDPFARTDMLDLCTNEALQVYAAENEPDDDVQHQAVRNINDQAILARIARNESEDSGVRGEAVVRLETLDVLEELAANANTEALQRDARHRLKILSTQAESQETRDAYNQAINRLIAADQWD